MEEGNHVKWGRKVKYGKDRKEPTGFHTQVIGDISERVTGVMRAEPKLHWIEEYIGGGENKGK